MAAVSMSDVVNHVADRTGMTKTQAKQAVSAVFDVIGESLSNGDRVQLSKFGTFETRSRAARTGTNPRTREKVQIPASTAVGFRAASELRGKVGK